VGKTGPLGVSGRHCHRTLGLRSVVEVDRKEEIREFLVLRRAKISPGQAGIPNYAELGRVPGLRREEVAVGVFEARSKELQDQADAYRALSSNLAPTDA
jgi:hypothetical protein